MKIRKMLQKIAGAKDAFDKTGMSEISDKENDDTLPQAQAADKSGFAQKFTQVMICGRLDMVHSRRR
jgi:hypothetical protein